MDQSEPTPQPILLREDRVGVGVLTLNRPAKLNALSNELIAALMDALDSIELDASVRAIVITGAGRAFQCRRRQRRVPGPHARQRGPAMG